jgi:hypothetical protein
MNYKIHTTPVWDAFKEDSECPLCDIENGLSAREVSMYLNEAVMEPSYRVNVNKKGFCQKHFRDLQSGDNICGLGLQCLTRLETLKASLVRPASAKDASREASRVEKQISGCVICDAVNENMSRYYETIAAMFLHEPEFERLLRSSKGFCFSHYAALLAYAKHAGRKAASFSDVLYNKQFSALSRLLTGLEDFTDMFDSQKPKKSGVPKDAVEKAIKKMR